MNAQSVNIALALLIGQHNEEQNTINEIAKLREENAKLAQAKSKTKQVKARKSNGSQAAPIHHGPTVFGVMMPDATFSDSLPLSEQKECAKTFLLNMRQAGKRMVEGKLVFQQREAHNDRIQAIAGFIGYDNHEMFGAQETAANMLAQRLLAKVDVMAGPDRLVQRQSDLSAKGFVHGLPAPVAAKLEDLQAREIIAADSMIAHQKEATDLSRSEGDRELSSAMALVEQERLAHIQADIRALTF